MKNINIENYNIEMDSAVKTDQPFAFAIKRIIDVVISVILVIMLAPLFLIIGILIKIEGGSVFFGSKRLGRSAQEFSCLKFRTMVPNAEHVLQDLLECNPEIKIMYETHRKIQNDPRITKIGKVLRTASLDELPQLINIIKGEMSLVGPRPILLDEADIYGKSQCEIYYTIRPGLTGLWQVSGRNNMTFEKRVCLDMQYIKNWSLRNDIAILLRTFSAVLARKGAY